MAGMRKGRKRNVKEGNVKEGNQGNYLTLRLGEKILIERKKSGLSQGQLADMLGVTRQSVSKWESGAAVPELAKLVAIAEVFGVSLDYLVREQEPRAEDTARLEEKLDRLTQYVSGYEYTSKTKVFGIPLVSIRLSKNRTIGRDSTAKGIIAIGNVAIGVFSLGAVSIGVVSIGGIALGLIVLGALAFGVLAFGALAIGIIACGVSAIGIYSTGVASVGKEIAVGIEARGKTAIGESAIGRNRLLLRKGVTEQQIELFLGKHHPRLWGVLREWISFVGTHMH